VKSPDTPAPEVAERTPPELMLQRKCACGGGGASALTGECDDCDKKKLQRRASGHAPHDAPKSVSEVLATSGAPLDPVARRDMESRFGHDFGSVRIHTDARAAQSARDTGALAYTVGSHVVFGQAQYAPATYAGRHLLAHELTHTIQQRSGFKLQRQAISAPGDAAEVEADRAADTVTGTYLVDDDAQPATGQMRKTEFLDELQSSSCIAADAELARVGRSTEGCPFIERAFSRYRTMPAARVEQAIRRYIDPSGVTSASDYIPLVARRVAEGVARWAETGDMSGVPPELAAGAMGGGGGLLGMLAGGIGRLLFKREGGGAATPAEAAMVSSSLGGGAPLDSGVRGRMENAFGHDFSRVRVHSGGTAASMSSTLGARAFTLGGDIGFAAGEYRPNTLVGDALIAHELAHVVQQSGGGTGATGEVEEDADVSAAGAVMSLWGGAKQIARKAMPRLRSGLRLQRCSSKGEFPFEGIIIRTADLQSAPPPPPPAPVATHGVTPVPDPKAKAPAATPASQVLAVLPNGTRVEVKARNGAYVQVEAEVGRETLTGWVEESAVSDVVAQEMQGMVARTETAMWQKSGGKDAGTGNTFQKWALADFAAPLPELSPSTSINCWEMIFYAAIKVGVLNWYTVHDLYVNVPMDLWPGHLTRSREAYDPAKPNIRRGNLVFFNDLDHVALATGNGDEVYTFWPPPDVEPDWSAPFARTVDRVKISTVAKLSEWIEKRGTKKKKPRVEQGQPTW
jgi:Domain of unknown function (DUF4157)